MSGSGSGCCTRRSSWPLAQPDDWSVLPLPAPSQLSLLVKGSDDEDTAVRRNGASRSWRGCRRWRPCSKCGTGSRSIWLTRPRTTLPEARKLRRDKRRRPILLERGLRVAVKLPAPRGEFVLGVDCARCFRGGRGSPVFCGRQEPRFRLAGDRGIARYPALIPSIVPRSPPAPRRGRRRAGSRAFPPRAKYRAAPSDHRRPARDRR